jgi:hypothetical protein
MAKAAESAGIQWDIEGRILIWWDGLLKISSGIKLKI